MKNMINSAILIAALLLAVPAMAENGAPSANEIPSPETAQPEHDYVFPVIEPEAEVRAGYRYIHLSGDRKAAEFEYPHRSLTFGGEVRAVNERHRLHLDVEYNNPSDYEGDLTYAFRNIVLFRWLNSTLYHNLDNTPPVDLDPSTSTVASVNVLDKNRKYGRTVGINSLLLRFKTPDFPAHLYFEGVLVDKNSTQQQKFLGGTASFGGSGTLIQRTSQRRDLDMQTRIYTVGINSHLGPIEADYSHSEKRFDVGQSVPVFAYMAPGFGDSAITCSGPSCSYSHNGVPETKSSTDTLKIHTTYTGQIVASAAISKTEKDNRENSAHAEILFGAADFTYMPADKVTIFLKYRHRESDLESPERAFFRNLTDDIVYSSEVYQPISSISDKYSAAVRFRPVSAVTLRGEIDFDKIRRDNNDNWNTPDSTEKTTMILSADMKLHRSLKFKLRYTTINIDDPGHNTEPDSSNDILTSISWNPISRLTAFLSYTSKHTSRDRVHFLYTDSSDVTHDLGFGQRKVDDQKLTGVVNYAFLNNLSATGSYAFGRVKTRQDITYACGTGGCGSSPSGTPFADSMVPFTMLFQSVGLDITYMPQTSLTMKAGVAHTTTEGRFSPSNLLGQKVIDEFSELKTRETSFTASGEYRLKNGYGIGMNYRYVTFRDETDNMLDDVRDGRVQVVFLTLSKKW